MDGLTQRVESMKRDGQVQPVVVRRVGDTWQLVVGERRWRAAQLAGLKMLAAVEREATDELAFQLAVIENLHREDLSHQEQVEALDTLAELVSGTGFRPAAAELNMSPGWLSRRLSMHRIPTVFPALEDGRISFMQANELLGAPRILRGDLLDRVLTEPNPVQIKALRACVGEARAETRRDRSQVRPAAVATHEPQSAPDAVYGRILEDLNAASAPTTVIELEALKAIAERVKKILRGARVHTLPAAS